MPKGYLVANIRVTDADKFAAFSGMAGPVIKAHGGKVLAKGPDAERHEGNVTGTVMMIEFDSLNLHCSSDFNKAGITRKIGLSIFTEIANAAV